MKNPVAKGMAEIKAHRLERFKIHFSKTTDFELLVNQFQASEIFKMKGEKFEIPTIQQAFETWLAELKPTPRPAFIKDLDKLLSGDYVLVPKAELSDMQSRLAHGG